MSMRRKIVVFSVLALTTTGCCSKKVSTVEGISKQDEICIIENTEVRSEFLDVYKASIEKQGYKTSIKKGIDESCVYTSRYTATYGFHWGPYLATADLKIFKGESLIGSSKYKAPKFDVSKHGKVVNKIEPLVQKMLAN